VILKWSSNS